MERVVTLSQDELLKLACDARLVAIRWDLIRWCLVLDLDMYVSEAEAAPSRRMWIIFNGVSNISWHLDHARLPIGCWLSSDAETVILPEDFILFKVVTLAPSHGSDGSVNPGSSRELRICAKALAGIASTESAIPGEYGFTRTQRLHLANDDEMLEAAQKALGVVLDD